MKNVDLWVNYRPEVQEYMLVLQTQLIKNYGQIAPEWGISLRMIADNYQMYLDCGDQIKIDGLMLTNSKGDKIRNPLCTTQHNCQAQLVRLSHQFALNIMSMSKVSKPELADENDDYINSL